MKKGVIAIAGAVVVAAGIVLPAGYLGQVAEKTIKGRLANMPYGYEIEVAEYRRGWFSSTARLEWRPPGNLGPLAMPAQDVSGEASPIDSSGVPVAFVSGPVAVDIEIAHGPVFFAVSPGVGLFNARGRIDPGSGDAEPPAQSGEDCADCVELYVTSFSGRTVSHRLQFDGLEWRFGPAVMTLGGGQMAGEWSGADGLLWQQTSLRSMDLDTGMEEAGLRVSMTDFESRAEYPQGLAGGAILAASESNASVGETLISGADGSAVMRIAGFSAATSTARGEDGLYRATGGMEMEALEVLGREFAPVEMTLDSGGFGEAALLKMVTALGGGVFETPPDAALPGEGLQAGPEVSPAAAIPPLAADMKEAIRALMADGPYAEVSAVLTYQEEHELKLDVAQAIEPDRVAAGADMASLPALLSALDLALNIEIPLAAAEELLGETLLQGNMARNLLEETDTAYRLALVLRDGAIELNGQVLPLTLPSGQPSPFDEDTQSPFDDPGPSPFDDAEPSPFDDPGPSPFDDPGPIPLDDLPRAPFDDAEPPPSG